MAVFIGAILIMSPLTGLMFLAVWVLVALVFRTSSLSAIIALILTAPFLALLGESDTAVFVAFMVALSLWAHRENIARLRAGTELENRQVDTLPNKKQIKWLGIKEGCNRKRK